MSKKIRNMVESITIFDTDELPLAAALLVKGHELIAWHSIHESSSLLFHFEDSKRIRLDEKRFWDGNLYVDAMSYWAEIGNLIEVADEKKAEEYEDESN